MLNRHRLAGTELSRPSVSSAPGSSDVGQSLHVDQCRIIHRDMVRARAMEERMIKMAKSSEGYFWIGGPGEEAFNVCLGHQIKKGRGPAFDYMHFSYRNSATMLAMGMPMIDAIRQTAMTATDSNSMGRNFIGHYCKPEWNVVPVTSVVAIQRSGSVMISLATFVAKHASVAPIYSLQILRLD